MRIGLGIDLGRAIGSALAGGGGAALTLTQQVQALFAGSTGAMFDLDDPSLLFQLSGGTTAVTATSDPVGYVTDVSGNGNHARQATAGNRPTWHADGYAIFDGLDDFWATAAVDFTVTDAVTVVAAVHKLSDAATGSVIELGTGGENGSFRVTAPSAAAANVSFLSRGTAQSIATLSGIAAPITVVISAQGEISTDLSRIRVNGGGWTSGATDQGLTANYISGALYIGQRGVATNPLNGRVYRLLVIGRLLSADELLIAEAWANETSGAY